MYISKFPSRPNDTLFLTSPSKIQCDITFENFNSLPEGLCNCNLLPSFNTRNLRVQKTKLTLSEFAYVTFLIYGSLQTWSFFHTSVFNIFLVFNAYFFLECFLSSNSSYSYPMHTCSKFFLCLLRANVGTLCGANNQ